MRGVQRHSNMVSVMDSAEGVCVDPGAVGAILETGGPARQAGEKAGSWHQTVEEGRRSGMPQNTGDGVVTTPSDVYAQSECHSALCINYYTDNQNRNRVLL
jgi:hypothetical protein